MSVDKFNGVSLSSIGIIDGVRKELIDNLNGVTVPAAFSNTKSLFTDGVDDYFDIDLASDIFDKDNGTISTWVRVDSSNTSTKWFLEAWDDSNNAQGRIALQYFNVSGTTIFALNGQYQDQVGATYPTRFCGAKTGSSHHGKPWNRISSDYGAFGSSDTMWNANAMKSNWHHVVLTWNTSESYTDPTDSTSYTGTMKLYVDGTLVNFGQGAYVNNGLTATAVGLNGIPSSTVFDKLRIGARFNGGNDMDALFDEVAVYNTDLSASNISAIYNSGSPNDLSSLSTSTNLVGWWRFEDNTDDSSSNSNSGTLTNGATYNSSVPS
jgi:hypothetical protein